MNIIQVWTEKVDASCVQRSAVEKQTNKQTTKNMFCIWS